MSRPSPSLVTWLVALALVSVTSVVFAPSTASAQRLEAPAWIRDEAAEGEEDGEADTVDGDTNEVPLEEEEEEADEVVEESVEEAAEEVAEEEPEPSAHDADDAGATGQEESEGRIDAPAAGTGQTVLFSPPPRAGTDRDFQLTLPPIFHFERRGLASGGDLTTSAVFPLFYLQESPDHSELVIPPIYHREGRDPADVVFPLFWWFRGENHHSWVAGPVFHHEDPEGHDVGVLPFFASGRHRDGYYHLVPPVLGFAVGDADEDYLSVGLLGYRFRLREDERWGIFPLLWVRNSPREEYQFAPPLLFFRWRNPEVDRTLTIFSLFYAQQDPNELFFGLAGIFHHDTGPGFHSTTIPPLLFHFSEDAQSFRLSTPLFLYFREGQSETLVSWLYQRYRGATELDAVLPLFLHARDPRDHSQTLMVSPLFWHWSNPGSSNWLLAPLFLNLEEYGRSSFWATPLAANFRNHETNDETTWVAPTIQVSRWHDGDAVNVHPIWYYESVPSHRFSVLAPLWWDFQQFEQPSRYTVAFPFFYRVQEGETESIVTLPLASYFRRREVRAENRWEWELHASGLFDYGERSDGEHWWRVLYGLVGFEHRNDHDRLWLFWAPIDFPHAPTVSITPTTIDERR